MAITSVPNMPREGRTPRAFRIDDDDWADLGAVDELTERDRGWLLRKLVAWYLGRPGADLPEGPRGKSAESPRDAHQMPLSAAGHH